MKMKEHYEAILLSKFKESEEEYDYMVATNNFPQNLSNLAIHRVRSKSRLNNEQSKK